MVYRLDCLESFTMEENDNDQPTRKRRRLCPHCNQMLAKTTYWEHQRRYCGASMNCGSKEDSSSDSEFELEYDACMENDLGHGDNHIITHDDELQNEQSENISDEGKYMR